jgi:hypothetical protein
MSSQFEAKSAVAGSTGGRCCIFIPALAVVIVALSIGAAGCTPAATRVGGADPADPAARTARVDYRSTIAPYTSLRPSMPAPWRERNDSVAPRPGGERP